METGDPTLVQEQLHSSELDVSVYTYEPLENSLNSNSEPNLNDVPIA